MGSEVRWKIRRFETRRAPQVGNPVLSHPLLPKTAYYKKESIPVEKDDETEKNYTFIDPLGATNGETSSPEPFLPVKEEPAAARRLEKALDNTLETRETNRMVLDIILPNFIPWRVKRQQILDFSEKEPPPSANFSKIPFSKLDAPEKIRRRMEIMDDMTGLKKISETSHTEIIMRIRQTRDTLLNNWQQGKRVESIALITDLARMLSSTTNGTFYPQQWVLATDVLDLFGRLIFDRLLEKSNEERRSLYQSVLSPSFTSDDTPKEATEVAKNWFCKIADIKELLPRFYVETSMIGCLRFLDSSSIRVNLIRLASMTSKFTHVLQAAYARAYLSKIAMHLDPADRAPHWRVLNDWMQGSMPQMPELTSFALEWIIQCVAYGAASINDIGPIWEYCKQDGKRGYIIQAFLKGVPVDYLVDHILDVISLLIHKNVSGKDLAVLGDRIILTEVPENIREEVFSSVWMATINLEKTDDFLRSANSWIRFAARHFPTTYICSILVKFVWRLSPLPDVQSSFGELIVSFLRNLLQYLQEDLLLLLKDENFVIVTKWLRDEEYCLETSREILLAFLRLSKPIMITEYVAYQMLEHSSILAQSLKPDSLTDDVNSTCSTICSVMDRIDLRNDLERALQWLVSIRATMGEWTQIVENVVEHLSRCALHCLAHIKANNKRAIWLRACIANIFITIPSISSNNQRFHYALQGTEIALGANSLQQADAMMKLCAEILNDFPANGIFVEMSSKWLSLLVSVPDSPNRKILYLFNAFLNILERKKWEDSVLFATVIVQCLCYLSAVGQPKITAAFANVATNDVIYGQSEKYMAVIEESVENLMEKYLGIIEKEDPLNPFASMTLLEFISTHFTIEGKIVSFVGNLLKKIAKSGVYQQRLNCAIGDLRLVSQENPSVHALLDKYNLL